MPENLMENLNSEQLKAVSHKDGPLLIVAGAGTGKTTVITQKIAYIIEQGWAKPEEILALTFTDKAAGEMEERVDRLLPIGYFDLWISTFHSFAEKILKEHGSAIGLPTDFKLLNEFEQWILVNKNLEKFSFNYYRQLGQPAKFIRGLLKHFSRAQDEDISPREYLAFASELEQDLDAMLAGRKAKKKKAKGEKLKKILAEYDQDAPLPEIAAEEVGRISELAGAYHVYARLLLENNALDFGGLLAYCLKLFRECPAILEKYRRQFKYILVDEFQDTNWAQYEIVKLLAGRKRNLIVVGDDDQSIYRFRGASMSNILQFKKDYPESREIFLVKNYRSRQNILDLSYEFIKQNNPNRLEWRLNNEVSAMGGKKEKKGGKKGGPVRVALNKRLLAVEEGAGEIQVLAGDNLEEEAELVAEKIMEIKDRDSSISWDDFAILVRANDSAKDFCAALDERGLPYIFLSSRGLYAKPVIMDAIAYLKMLDDYHESRALYRVLSAPIFEFSQEEIAKLNYLAKKNVLSLFEVLKNSSGLRLGADLSAKAEKVISLIERHASLAREKTVAEIFIAFFKDSGYLKYLTAQKEEVSRESMSYLNQFYKRLKQFEAASDDKRVRAFLAELEMELMAGDSGRIEPDLESGPEAIKVLTVHGAKGLEFKHVFVVGLVDKRFPTTERKEAIPLPDALIKETISEGDEHLEEERRLFYVALTRAKEGLYFSYAPDYGGARRKKPSRFLSECALVDGRARENVHGRGRDIFADKKIALASANKKIALPGYFSFTQLAAYSNCPYQYRFAHVLKVPVPGGRGALSFGKTMHAVMERIFNLLKTKNELIQGDLFSQREKKKAEISLPEIMSFYEQAWIDEWYGDKKERDEYKEKGRKILVDFYEKHKNNWPEVIFTEKEFSLKMGESGERRTIKGKIDRLDRLPDGRVRIVDYKTGRAKKALVFQDKEQLLIYQLAAADIFREPIGALCFYYLEDNSFLEFLGKPNELEKVKEKIAASIAGIESGDFPPQPEAELCRWCDFKDICDKSPDIRGALLLGWIGHWSN